MKRPLKNFTPGQRGRRLGGRDNRWLDWAQSLARRHARVAESHCGLSLTFLRPAPPPLFDCERWSRAAWTIAPQINLSIGPILRSLRQAASHQSKSERKAPPPSAAPSSHFAPNSGDKTIVERWGVLSRIDGVEHIEGLRTFAVDQRNDLPQRPLRTVFARAMVEEAGERAPASRARRETLLVERSLQIARRVVEERRRVEEQARRALVARERRGALQDAAAAQETAAHSPRGSRVGARGMAQTAAPVIDIDQLTDRVVRNIDSRIIAHRERMGRLF